MGVCDDSNVPWQPAQSTQPTQPTRPQQAARTYLLRVADVVDIGPRMRRVTLEGDAATGLADFAPWPGQDVVVHLIDDRGARVRRRYTVRHLDPAGRFDLDFVMHGHGPGARWAQRAEPGEEVEVFGPRGKVAVSDARWQLYAGDDSALPAIAEMVEALPAGVSAAVFVEVTDELDHQAIEAVADLDLRWLHRGERPPGTADLLEHAIEGVAFPASDRHAFLFGESRVVRRLRDLARQRGLGPGEVSAKGYWNVGRAARDERVG